MSKFWCKVCGHELDPIEGAVVYTCGSCGARQVLPAPLGSEYLEYYARLVELQQSGQFDKAEELFENMLLDGGADAALYWLGILIDNRAVYKNVNGSYSIVCEKALGTSIMEQESFQKVLHYASPAQRGVFEKDGRMLEEARLAALGENKTVSEAELPLNKGFLCLEDGAWDAADAQFDRVLNEDPKNALAYFGKMMSELQIHREGELTKAGMRLSESANYDNVMKYGDELLCGRLKRYREEGILYQAAEHGKCAETIDDWKHVKKLLMEIRENEHAAEYLSLCDRKIRAIMVREAQLVMGCREAVNLGLTTENLGTRMVSANYYYDFDMSETSKNKKRKGFKPPSGRTVAIFALIVLLLLVAIFIISFFMMDDKPENSDDNNIETTSSVGEYDIKNKDYKRTYEDKKEDKDISGQICLAGAGAFTLDENGRVVCLNEIPDVVESEDSQNGASFTPNVTPYESDYDTWSDVARLYNDPDGAMLFGVMENGTVAYDIFSSSNMNYEAVYNAVSAWRDVSELVWEIGDPQTPCLFAVKKDGGLYVSDTEAEKSILSLMKVHIKDGDKIKQLSAKDGVLHIIMQNDSYISIKYR